MFLIFFYYTDSGFENNGHLVPSGHQKLLTGCDNSLIITLHKTALGITHFTYVLKLNICCTSHTGMGVGITMYVLLTTFSTVPCLRLALSKGPPTVWVTPSHIHLWQNLMQFFKRSLFWIHLRQLASATWKKERILQESCVLIWSDSHSKGNKTQIHISRNPKY
jgi:hypothetical protein